MKLTSVLAFPDIYAAIKDQKMPMQVAYKFSKLASKVETEIEFYRNKLQDIIDTYVQKDENGNPIMTEDGTAMKIIEGKEADCGKAMEELQELEIELQPSFYIADLSSLELTPTQMQGLLPFIIEE